MTFTKVSLGPTEGQMSDLAHGEEVKLGHHHMAGDVEMHLTNGQINRLKKAHAAGRGCTLKLSASQLKHHAQHGSGRLSDMIRSGYTYVKGKVKPVLRAGLHAGAQYAENRAASALGLNGEGFLGDAGRWLGHHAVDAAVGALGGGAMPPKKKRVVGKGFLSDALHIFGLGAAPAPKEGTGFLSDALHSIGLGVGPNPLANYNEQLQASIRRDRGLQKKSKAGQGLFQ